MAVPASTGVLSLSLYNLRVLVAASSTFQTWVGHSGDATSALAHVYRTSIDEDSITRPFAQVYHGTSWAFTDPATASEGNAFGSYGLLFEGAVAAGDVDNDEAAETRFSNIIGAILEDMMDAQGRGGYLIVRQFRKFFGPDRTRISKINDAMLVAFEVDWAFRGAADNVWR